MWVNFIRKVFIMTIFSDWLKRRDEYFGGSAGDPSGAGLDQPENGEREVTTDPNIRLDGSDKPPTKGGKQKIVGRIGGKVFSKKKCNCK